MGKSSDGEVLELTVDEGVITKVDAPPEWEWLDSTSWVGLHIEQLPTAIEARLDTKMRVVTLDGGGGRFGATLNLPTGQREFVATVFDKPGGGLTEILLHVPSMPRASDSG